MPELNSIEIWKPVLDWESHYEVSDFGNLRSIERMVRSPNGFRKLMPREIKQRAHKEGYMLVTLCRENKSLPVLVHRIVVEAFICRLPSVRRGEPYPDNWIEPNHIDGNKRNNRLDNLEINTRSQNIHHAIDTGLMKSHGEDNPMAVLTAHAVKAIRERHATGAGVRGSGYIAIAKEFGISPSHVRDIIKGRIWKLQSGDLKAN